MRQIFGMVSYESRILPVNFIFFSLFRFFSNDAYNDDHFKVIYLLSPVFPYAFNLLSECVFSAMCLAFLKNV